MTIIGSEYGYFWECECIWLQHTAYGYKVAYMDSLMGVRGICICGLNSCNPPCQVIFYNIRLYGITK